MPNDTRGKILGIDIYIIVWGVELRVMGDIEIADVVFDLDKRETVNERLKKTVVEEAS